jgi:hypothetical protein
MLELATGPRTGMSCSRVAVPLRDTERNAATRLFDGLRVAPIGWSEGARAGDWRRAHAAAGMTLRRRIV